MNIYLNSKDRLYWNIEGDKELLLSLFTWLKESHNSGKIISCYRSGNTFVLTRDYPIKESDIEKLKKG